mgnify:CR=1 FL=1
MNFAQLAAQVDRACVGTLGEAVSIGGTTVQAIWRQPYASAFDMSSTGPTCEYHAADAAATVGGTVVRGSESFRIRAIEPDGTGWSLLRLELAA